MSWSWSVFVGSLIVGTIVAMRTIGVRNRQNVDRYGHDADFRENPAAALTGSIVAGGIYAAIVTAVASLVI